jgi:K+-sensing histidine kinase KdpD
MTAAVTAVGFLSGDLLARDNLHALYLLAVFVSAPRWGRGPGIFCSILSVIVFDICFVPPRFGFAITDVAYIVSLLVFLNVAVITSTLASRARDVIRAQTARAEAEAARANAEAARIDAEATNRAKDALLRRISHELRSPLSAILGRIQLLQRAACDPEVTVRGLLALEHSAQFLARLVEDLLEASRAHVGKLRVLLEPTRIGAAVTQAAERASIAARTKGVTLQVAVDPVEEVLADNQRVEQIVTNLVLNAIKFTPAGGAVEVQLRQLDGCARLVVSDSGEGIPADFLPHLFEPFSQGATGKTQDGLGLGLSIVKHPVEAHHGHIDVASPGTAGGATFTVDFPHIRPLGPDRTATPAS